MIEISKVTYYNLSLILLLGRIIILLALGVLAVSSNRYIVTLSFSLVDYTNIPTDGSGCILISNIGFDDTNALICWSETPNPYGPDYYLHPSMQTTNQGDCIENTDIQGWTKNRDTPNGIIRLRRISTSWTEGVLTCRFHGISDPSISVGVYYSSKSHSAI